MTRRTPRGRTRPQRNPIAVSMLAIALAACLASCSTPSPDSDELAPAQSAQPTSAAPARTPSVDVAVTSSAPRAAKEVVPPTRLRIDQIGVDMPIVPVGVDGDSQMELPVDPAIAGWYRFGPDATVEQGHMVLSAHVDAPQYPIGPLADLRGLNEGASVVVTDASGSDTEYVIESVTYYPKTDLPVDDIFARGGEPAVMIITCGGPFDSSTGRYRDNVVAVAVPA